MGPQKYSYEDFLKDREVMPVFDESIFYPAIERRKLGISDEDMECIVEFFVGTSDSEIVEWIVSALLRF